MSAPLRGWESHSWNCQTMVRIVTGDGHTIQLLSNAQDAQPVNVSRALFSFYCPFHDRALAGGAFRVAVKHNILELFGTWLYTGGIASDSRGEITRLYLLANQLDSTALTRAAMSRLQQVSRNDESDYTLLADYQSISLIATTIGTKNSLYDYVQDTYRSHWRAIDDIDDKPFDHNLPNEFFYTLWSRSRGPLEGTDATDDGSCSCCHDLCKYHNHESDEERLATCGGGSTTSSDYGSRAKQPHHACATVEIATTANTLMTPVNTRVSSNLPVSDRAPRQQRDREPIHRRESARSTGLAVDAATPSTWLEVPNYAPVTFPGDFRRRLTALPSVRSLKATDWLERGEEREGVNLLPAPDRVVAAAMEWNAEDYAQTKCLFFNQYRVSLQPGDRRRSKAHWCSNVLTIGGSRGKQRAERLWDMWGCLGWLDERHYTDTGASAIEYDHRSEAVSVANRRNDIDIKDEPQDSVDQTSSTLSIGPQRIAGGSGKGVPRIQAEDKAVSTPSSGSNRKPTSWSDDENAACIQIMREICTQSRYAHIAKTEKRFEIISQRMKAEFGFDRKALGVRMQWNRYLRASSGIEDRSDKKRSGSGLATSSVNKNKSNHASLTSSLLANSSSQSAAPITGSNQPASSGAAPCRDKGKQRATYFADDGDEDDKDKDNVSLMQNRGSKRPRKNSDSDDDYHEWLQEENSLQVGH